jgi:hypothetical protein
MRFYELPADVKDEVASELFGEDSHTQYSITSYRERSRG